MKRIKGKTLRKWAISSGIIGILALLIFPFLIEKKSITVGNYNANEYCGGDILCFLELNKVCFKEDVFLYPMNASDIINAEPKEEIIDLRLLRSWDQGWRNIPLNDTCKGSWCGCYWCNKNNKAKYSYAFRNNSCYNIRFEVKKSVESNIKWNINPKGEWKALYNYIYENKSRTVKVYVDTVIKVPEKQHPNGSKTKAYNYSISEFSHNKIEYYSGERIGVRVKGIKKMGFYTVCNDILVRHLVDPGDRNEVEYCRCRKHELEKGVCAESKI